MNLMLQFRHKHASHFTLGDALYSRSDTGEWFLAYSRDSWQPLAAPEAERLEVAFQEWKSRNPPMVASMMFETREFDEPLRETTDENS